MNIKRLIKIGKVLCVTGIAFALPLTVSAATQVGGVTVTKVSIYSGSTMQGAMVWISPALPDGTESCSYTPANILWIDFSSTTQPDGKSLYATVMSAFLAGHQVTFAVSGCGDAGQHPLVYRVDVLP
ncbi:MAG: hypothetical protein ABUS47_02830 [Steroidobacter sp.]